MPLLLYSPKRKQLQAAIENIILQYHFDAGSGSNIMERVSKVNHSMTGLSTGTVMWDNTMGQYGIRKKYSDTANSTAMQITGNLTVKGDHTVSAWFKCSGWNANVNGGTSTIFALSSLNASCDMYRDGYSGDGRLYTQGSTFLKYALPAYNAITNIMWVRSGNVVSIYINGVNVVSGTVPAFTVTGKYVMLNEMRYMSNLFILYNVTVFNKALSATERTNYQALGSNYAV